MRGSANRACASKRSGSGGATKATKATRKPPRARASSQSKAKLPMPMPALADKAEVMRAEAPSPPPPSSPGRPAQTHDDVSYGFKPETPEKKRRANAKPPRRLSKSHAKVDKTPEQTHQHRTGKMPATPRNLESALEQEQAIPSRRPVRRPKSAAMTEEQIAEMLRKGEEPGLDQVLMPEMGGFGVFVQKTFYRGDFVCEYSGDLIDLEEARQREQAYILEDLQKGIASSMCYMYYLKHSGKKWCVDATKSGRIGRLINHSRLSPNLRTRLFSVDGVPRLGLCAIKDIEKGTELHYDYGERDPQALAAHPWLKS